MASLWCIKCHATLTDRSRYPGTNQCKECYRAAARERARSDEFKENQTARRNTKEGQEARRRERQRAKEKAAHKAEVAAKVAEILASRAQDADNLSVQKG